MIRLVLILIFFARAAFVASDLNKPEAVESELICETEDCKDISKLINDCIDSSVNVCDDFYQRSCNRTKTKQPTLMTRASSILKQKLRDFLESSINGTSTVNDRNTVRILKFYKSCMNSSPKELDKLVSALETQTQIMDANNFDWSEMMISLTREGFGNDHLFEVSKDLRQNKLEIKPANFSYLNTPNRKHKLERLLGMIESSSRFTRMDDDDLVYKVNSLVGSLLVGTRESGSDRVDCDLGQLTKMHTNIPWAKFLSGLSFGENLAQKISLSEPAYFDRLNYLVTREDRRTLEHLMLINVLAKLGSLLDEGLAQLTGRDPMKCVRQTGLSMIPSLLPVIAKHIFGLDNIESINHMVDQLKLTFYRMILDSSMISNVTTKSIALRKLINIEVDLACPRELLNDTLLDEIYKGIEMEDASICDNIIKSNRIRSTMNKSFGDPIWTRILRDIRFDGNSLIFQAYYYPGRIYVFPALVSPFITPDNTNYVKYAVLGSMIGHEIGHAFGPNYRNIDDRNQNFLWDPKSDNNYMERSANIWKQYGGCNVSLPDDMSDNMGYLVAYRAYSDWLASAERFEQKLPGFSGFTEKQLFWMSLANLWCEEMSKPDCAEHSASVSRINEPLKNYLEFSDDFGCQSGQPMNPKQKNVIW